MDIIEQAGLSGVLALLIVPVCGATVALYYILIPKAVLLKKQGKNDSFRVAVASWSILLVFLIIYGFFLGLSGTILFWLPVFPAPALISKIVGIYLVFYWLCFLGLLGISGYIAVESGSAKAIFKKLFRAPAIAPDKSNEKEHPG